MIPKGSQGIRHLAQRLRDDLGGMVEDAYLAAELRLIGNMLDMVASDFDRAILIIKGDVADISAILRQALAVMPDLSAGDVILSTLACCPDTLLVPELRGHLDALMVLLGNVHAEIDDNRNEATEIRELNLNIWRFLDAHIHRNSY